MKKLIAVFLLALMPGLSFAAEHSLELDKVDIDLTDKAALQDGARTFANYCMGCHSAKFQRYERVADDLGIPHELMLENLVFTGAKIGDHMKIGMQPNDAKTWFGAAPPDLTLVARVRGTGCTPTCAASTRTRAALPGEQQGLPERRHAQRAGRPAG
jgi:ubiquinol-cytochrome c reductase cytochrome c1 subunit